MTPRTRAPSALFSAISTLAALAALSVTGAGCVADEGDVAEDVEITEDGISKRRLFERVVIGRAFQTGDATLPAIDYTGDGVPDVRDAAYVCQVLAALKPTYVSGLMRYGAKRKGKDGKVIPRDEVTAEQADFFNGVRACVRAQPDMKHTKFDVVLNADEYETASEFVDHMKAINAALHPDGWYFDFLARGWEHHRPAVRKAIEWAHHGSRKQFVGGTIWGQVVPDGVDYVALDDYENADPENPTGPGWQRMTAQAKGLHETHRDLHILFHLENNPTGKENNHGDDWIEDDPIGRIHLMEKHAEAQSKVGYHYMYPVFFPISYSREGALAAFAPDPADPAKPTYKGQALAYDASIDPNMMGRMKRMMDKHNKLSKAPSSGGASRDGDPNGGPCDTWAELKVCRQKCEKAYQNQSKVKACKVECDKKCD